MIDYETHIFDTVYPYIAPLCAEGAFTSAQVPSPRAYPAVSLFELSNTTIRNRQSSTPGENFVRVAYQLDIYAQSKAECRKVFAAADEILVKLNFNRISATYIDNAENVYVFRYTARYEAEIDTKGNLYRRA